jgi:hypothetical protein
MCHFAWKYFKIVQKTIDKIVLEKYNEPKVGWTINNKGETDEKEFLDPRFGDCRLIGWLFIDELA